MDKKIKQQLNSAMDCLPKPDANELWEIPVQKMGQLDCITQHDAHKKSIPPIFKIASAIACLMFVFLSGFGWYVENKMIDCVVGLDVNPSFEITINRRQQVLCCKGLNEEAAAILQGKNYRGIYIEDMVESLMLSLYENEYLFTGMENAVLLSVSSKDYLRADELSVRLSKRIQRAADKTNTPTTVLRQCLVNGDVDENETVQGSSSGKLHLVKALAEMTGRKAADLLSLSMEELTRLAAQAGVPDLTIDRSIWIYDDQDDDDDINDDASNEDEDQEDKPIISVTPRPAKTNRPQVTPPQHNDDIDDVPAQDDDDDDGANDDQDDKISDDDADNPDDGDDCDDSDY